MTIVPPAPAVLVVEDEWLIADMVDRSIVEGGFRTIGPAATVAQALALIATRPCDAAVLDINLGEDKSFGLIDRLAAARTPMVLVTGYNRSDLPERYRGHRMISKPVDLGALVAALRQLVEVPPPA